MKLNLSTIDINVLVAVAGFLLGLGTTLTGIVIWYGNSVKKRYAAERDFNHLKTNYQQLAQNQTQILGELDDVKDVCTTGFIEIKALLYRGRFNPHPGE